MGMLRRSLAEINGDDNNNILVGLEEDDVINAFGAQDQVTGRGGNDRIDGGDGNDQLIGGEGDDYVIGGQGQDVITFGRGNDILVGGQGQDDFVAYALAPEDRGNQVFKYLGGNEGADTITGFNPTRDSILIPEGTAFVVSENGNDTRVEFGGTRVDLLLCNCANEVNVVTDIGDAIGNTGNNELPPEAVAAIATTIPLLLFAMAAIIFYRRPRESGDMLITIEPGTGRDSFLSGISMGSARSRGVSQWFYMIYGRSGRFSAETDLTKDTRARSEASRPFTEIELGTQHGQKRTRTGTDRHPPRQHGDRKPRRNDRPRRKDPESFL